jgi:hypothetical protein
MSATKLTEFEVRKVGKKDWEFLTAFIVLVVVDGVEYLIRVPPKFVTDFASVPRLPLVFMMFGGIGDYAAGVHDYLYSTAEYPRDICDAIFREILICLDDTSDAAAWAMHKGVRLGGAAQYGWAI